MRDKVCFVIFSGFNERSVICLCRTLRKLDMPFCIVALSADDPCLNTYYSANIAAIRQHREPHLADFDDCLEKVRQHTPATRYVIAPSSEFLNIFLLDNRTHFKALGFEIPLPEKVIYKQLSDKKEFTRLCETKQIPIPEEINPSELRKSLPLVAKPISDITENGRRVVPEIIETESGLEDFIEHHDNSLYFYQRYIKGKSFYFLIYRHADGRVDSFSQRNLLQQPNGKSIVLAQTADLHLTSWIDPYLEILADLNYRGLAMVEVKEQDGRYYMIEVNPRMWGPAQLMADAGHNLFVSFINDWTKNNFPWRGKCRSTHYLWSGGIADILDRGEVLDAHASIPEVLEALRAKDIKDIYGRSDTKYAFRSEQIELKCHNIRETI